MEIDLHAAVEEFCIEHPEDEECTIIGPQPTPRPGTVVGPGAVGGTDTPGIVDEPAAAPRPDRPSPIEGIGETINSFFGFVFSLFGM